MLSKLILRLEKVISYLPHSHYVSANLRQIVRNDFSMPSVPHPHIPPYGPLSSPPPPSQVAETASQTSTTSTQSTNKENAPPHTEGSSGDFPPQIRYLLDSITSTLNTLFAKHPPHTVQRLAELILFPKQHYKTLPSYLHAMDRVVHVTSGAHIFPLPPAIPDPSSSSILSNGGGLDPLSITWGNRSSSAQAAGLGSDESLGGALLTPIAWLSKSNGGTRSPLEGEVKTESTEMIDGPNGPGGVETVSVSVNGVPSTRSESLTISADNGATSLRMEGGVTQGELLRQEQRAGVVPVSQLEGNRGDSDGLGEEDEVPHARGPEEIGMEDMGPQGSGSASQRGGSGVGMQGIDIEAAVGRKVEKELADIEKQDGERPDAPKREAEEEIGSAEKKLKMDETQGDIDIEDADKAEQNSQVDSEGKDEEAESAST